ncbi:MAG: TRAP transporter large permease [Pseudomonadota bacterium]
MLLAATALLFLLLASGSHVAVALGLVTAGLLLAVTGVPPVIIGQTAFKAVNSYALVAVPFFVLVGDLMMRGRLTEIIVQLIGSVMRVLRGGLAMTVTLACVFFAAVSGSSVASAAAIGSSSVKALQDEGYPPRFAAALVAVGGTLGIMIPPSLVFIIIGSIIGLPIDRLFLAGILPGLLEAALMLLGTYLLSRTHGYGRRAETVDWPGFRRQLPLALPALLMPVLILGGIYGGFFTPTEVSAVAAADALVLWGIAKQTVLTTSMIFAVVMGGSLLGFMLTRMGISRDLAAFVTEHGVEPWMFLLFVNVLLLVLGMFLDGVSLVVLAAPALFPIAMQLGIDPIHFAVIMVANVEIGTLTPPVGLNLFVISGIARLPLEQVVRGVLPFYALRLLSLAIITYVPWVSLALVR